MNFIRENQLNIMLSLSSVCFTILLFLLINNYLSKEKRKSLIIIAFSTAFLLLTDRYAYIFRGQTTTLAYIMARICKYLVFFNVLNISYMFNEFLISIYKEYYHNSHPPKMFKLIKTIILTGHITLIISQFTNWYYSFDKFNNYHRESGYVFCYLFPILATIIQYIIVGKYYRKTNNRIMIPIVLYFILPIITTIIQLFIPGVSLTNMAIAGVVIILYSFTIYDANVMSKEKEKTEADLRLANEIQQNEIPNEFPAFPERKEFDLYALMSPAKDVGGDFYDYFLLDDDHLGLVIADVSGKGIPAALNMIKVKVLLRSVGLKLNNPAKVLSTLNDIFIDNNKLEMFVTMWFGILEISTGKLTYVNAGHEDLIIYKKSVGYESVKIKHGLPIGAMNNSKYENHQITVNKGDKLFLFTDGITEAININNKSFGINNLLKSLNKHKNNNVEDTIKLVKKDIELFTNSHNQFDDITMLCLELKDNNDIIHLNKRFNAIQGEIDKAYDYFTAALSDYFSLEKIKKYYIILDEVFSNIVKYGYKDINDDREEYIDIDLVIDNTNNRITATFVDNGIKFNPIEKENPDISLTIDQRKEGGLGIYIVKNMVDKVSYKYKDNKNYLILEKNLKNRK